MSESCTNNSTNSGGTLVAVVAADKDDDPMIDDVDDEDSQNEEEASTNQWWGVIHQEHEEEDEPHNDHHHIQSILGTSQVLEQDLSHLFLTYHKMKQELEQLQRERSLTQQALLATQCSQTIVTMRLEQHMAKEEEEGDEEEERSIMLMSSLLSYSSHILEEGDDESDDDDSQVAHQEEDAAASIADPESSLDEEIRRILPTHSQSLGGGLLGDMDKCILEWESTFQLLNDQHQHQVQACHHDIHRLHVRLDAMKAVYPKTPLIEQAVEQAERRLDELLHTVEAFPTKSRLEALQRDLEASRQAEAKAIQDYLKAVEELETSRRREQELLERLERVQSGFPWRPKRKTPAIRFSLYTQRKLQRLFKLDRSARKRQNQEQPQQEQPMMEERINSAPSPIILDISSQDSSNHESSSSQDTTMALVLQGGSSKDEDPLVVFNSEEDGDWSSVHNECNFGELPTSLPTISPSKLSSSDGDTCYSETTETMTLSTSGSPPPKTSKAEAAADNADSTHHKTDTGHLLLDVSSHTPSWRHKTKTFLLWLQSLHTDTVEQ